MGWGFRKSRSIPPGIHLNLGKRGPSVSAGRRGARVSINTKAQKRASLSWHGFFWRKFF
jgi:hypothetical protein